MNKLILLLALLAIAAAGFAVYLNPGGRIVFWIDVTGREGLVHFMGINPDPTYGGCQVAQYTRESRYSKWVYYASPYMPWDTYMYETGVMPAMQCSKFQKKLGVYSTVKWQLYEIYNPMVRYLRRYAPE